MTMVDSASLHGLTFLIHAEAVVEKWTYYKPV